MSSSHPSPSDRPGPGGADLRPALLAAYMYNYLGGMGPHQCADGTLEWSLPISGDSIMSIVDPKADYGTFVRAAIESPSLGAGSTTLACAEEITLHEMNRQFCEGELDRRHHIRTVC